MYKRIKCMWHKLLYLNFILYDVTLVTDLKKNKNILLYIMLYINLKSISWELLTHDALITIYDKKEIILIQVRSRIND